MVLLHPTTVAIWLHDRPFCTRSSRFSIGIPLLTGGLGVGVSVVMLFGVFLAILSMSGGFGVFTVNSDFLRGRRLDDLHLGNGVVWANHPV